MWGISYFKLDSLKERKFAFQRIKFTFQRIKFAFQRIKFAFQRIKFASKESSCFKVVVSSIVHRTLSAKWHFSVVIVAPDDVSVICISRAIAL